MPLAQRVVKATDSFTSSISGSWVNGPGGWNDLQWISSGNIRGSNTGDCAMRRDAETFNENQYSRSTVGQLSLGAGTYASIHAEVAMQAGTSPACYFGQLRTFDGKYAIYEVDSGFGVTELARTGTAPSSYTSGDYIVLERIWTGSTNDIELYSAEGGGSETLRLSTTDATLRGGKPGCGCNADVTSIAISSWEGGDDGLQTLVQSTRFDNTNTFYGGSVNLTFTGMFDGAIFDDAIFDTGGSSSPQTLVQNTLFTNTNTFYGGLVNVRQTLVQSSRFNNTNQFYTGQVNLRLSQASRFNNANSFFGGQVDFRLSQGTRFNNSNQFFGGVVSLSGGTQTLVQSTRFNNTNSFFGSKVNFVLLGTRFNNTNQFFGGQVNSRLFQTTRFDNINTFYDGFVSLRLIQSARFNNANQFFGGSINLVLQQAVRFDNANQFFGGTVSISSGPQTLVQNSRFDNSNTFYGGSIIQPGVFTTSTVYWG